MSGCFPGDDVLAAGHSFAVVQLDSWTLSALQSLCHAMLFRCLQCVFVENIPFGKKAVAGFNCFYYWLQERRGRKWAENKRGSQSLLFCCHWPVACGRQLVGLQLSLCSYLCFTLALASHKRHTGIIKTGCRTEKESYYYGERKSEEVVV